MISPCKCGTCGICIGFQYPIPYAPIGTYNYLHQITGKLINAPIGAYMDRRMWHKIMNKGDRIKEGEIKDEIAKLCSLSYQQGAIDFKLSLLESLQPLVDTKLITRAAFDVITQLATPEPIVPAFIKEY